MSQHYSNPSRESDEHALPDVEIFQLTAEEACSENEEVMEAIRRRFPLVLLNSGEWDRAITWAIVEYGIQGGWFYQACFPVCLPDGEAMGPFPTHAAALAAAQEEAE